MKLKGKKVLITGSSRGIGKAIAFAFAKEGCEVILNASKSGYEMENTADEIIENGGICRTFMADVSDYSQCEDMFETIGNIDILINNAGISYLGLFSDMKPSDWERVMNVNINSVFNCTHLAIPHMVHKKSGIIINISSMWGDKGASCEAVYSASKGAVNSFTKAMAKELGPSGIRVNAISCGVIDTKMNAWLSDEERAELADEISLMRFGNSSEVADLAVFLASEKSEFINGQVITIDGGMF